MPLEPGVASFGVRHNVGWIHLGTVVHDPHLGRLGTGAAHMWSTTHRVLVIRKGLTQASCEA